MPLNWKLFEVVLFPLAETFWLFLPRAAALVPVGVPPLTTCAPLPWVTDEPLRTTVPPPSEASPAARSVSGRAFALRLTHGAVTEGPHAHRGQRRAAASQ